MWRRVSLQEFQSSEDLGFDKWARMHTLVQMRYAGETSVKELSASFRRCTSVLSSTILSPLNAPELNVVLPLTGNGLVRSLTLNKGVCRQPTAQASLGTLPVLDNLHLGFEVLVSVVP